MTREELNDAITAYQKAQRKAAYAEMKAKYAAVYAAQCWLDITKENEHSRPEDIKHFESQLEKARIELEIAKDNYNFWLNK